MWSLRWAGAGLLIVAIVTASPPAVASRPSAVIVLPGATSAEGIAAGRGATFFAGELFTGDIFRGNSQRGSAERFIDAPEGRFALGMKVDLAHGLLFVAGGPTGQGYIYDISTGSTVATCQFSLPQVSFINDVALTDAGAWFTDSSDGRLFFVPVSRSGVPGPFSTVLLSGPAAALSGQFNLNGIAATSNGKLLIVSHTAAGRLYTVNPRTGTSATIADINVPNVDGIVLNGSRLWAVQNLDNQVTKIRLSPDLRSGEVEKIITSELFQTPTAAALQGHRLAVVNAKFDTGFPPTADSYEVVLVNG